jgi:hypothetical protein
MAAVLSMSATLAEPTLYTTAMSADPREPPPTPEQEARDRRAANIFLLVAGALVAGIGIWLVNALIEARRADDCLSAGRRNCTPIAVPPR